MIANTVTKANNLCALLRERLNTFSAGEDFSRTFSPPIDTVPCDVAGQLEDAVDLLLKMKAGQFNRPMPDLFRITGLQERGSVVQNHRKDQ